MHWQVVIPDDSGGGGTREIAVEARNWFSALRLGLENSGKAGMLVSNLSCSINFDRSVTVTDFVTGRVFLLRPLEKPDLQEEATAPPAEKQATPQFAPPVEDTVPARPDPVPELASDLAQHSVFFRRDEEPGDGSGILFRERLITVGDDIRQEEAARLAGAYYEQLRAMGSPPGTKLFINVQAFDHEPQGQAVRPAIVALSWKSWKRQEPKVLFPLSQWAPPAPTESTGAPGFGAEPAGAEPLEQTGTPPAATSDPESQTPHAPLAVPPGRKKHGAPPLSVVDDKIVIAFERIQEIYHVASHDEAATFALSLAHELIPCQAGSCMLISPGQYELYVAAAKGPGADTIIGRTLSLTRGIIGFATRTSSVITVSDPYNDPRFHAEFDQLSGFQTRNVACAPIQHQGRTIGAIELLNSQSLDGFNQDEANVLSYIAGALAEYIDTALPSREADFTDREFLEFLPGAQGSARAASQRKPAKSASKGQRRSLGSATKPSTKTDRRPGKPKEKKTRGKNR